MKKQLFFQKAVAIFMLIVFACCFALSLGISTPLYEVLRRFANQNGDPSKDQVQGASLYYQIQPFNQQLVSNTLICLIIAVLLFVTNTNSRRRYYISNYISIALTVVANILLANFALSGIAEFKHRYLTEVDFEELERLSEILGREYYKTTAYFDLCSIAFVLLIVATIALIGNLIWKILLLQREKRLLNSRPLAVEEEQK